MLFSVRLQYSNAVFCELLRKKTQYNGQKKKKKNPIQWPKEKGQSLINKTLHRKLQIGHHEPHNSGGLAVFCVASIF
jgi:hypothetical protein